MNYPQINTKPQIQESPRTPSRINAPQKRTIPRHIIFKLQKKAKMKKPEEKIHPTDRQR